MDLNQFDVLPTETGSEKKKIKSDGSKMIQEGKVISDPFWMNDFAILFRQDRLHHFFPTYEMTFIEKLNAITRLAIYLGVALYIVSQNYNWLYISILVPIFSIFLFKTQQDNLETYLNQVGEDSIENTINENELMQKPSITPTVNNPFMNANLITDDRTRAPATPSWNNEELKKEIEDKFNYNLYRDAGDLYGRNNSQREFYTMPATTIPNDQTAFAKWLYSTPSATCKENTTKCASWYDPIPSTNNPYRFVSSK